MNYLAIILVPLILVGLGLYAFKAPPFCPAIRQDKDNTWWWQSWTYGKKHGPFNSAKEAVSNMWENI